MKRSLLLSAPLLLSLAGAASAQTPASTPPPAAYQQAPEPESKDSINVSPLALMMGEVAVNYEHLFAGSHGLVVDAAVGMRSDSSSAETHGGVGAGYRWHWRGRQNSGFLGVMVHQMVGEGEVTESVNGEQTARYPMTIRSTSVTANVGKRWMLNDSWNITLRFGLGWADYTATAKDDTEEAKMAEKEMNALLEFIPIGFDGELSLGYNF